MAASKSYVEDLENELNCSICHDVFTDPKTLPCLHSFCARCLSQWYRKSSNPFKKQMDCPMCKTTIDVPDDDPSKLRSSFYLDSLLQLLHAMKTNTNQQVLLDCVSCEKPKALVAFCQQCDGSICDECVETHKSIKQLRNKHQPTMFMEFKQENITKFIKNEVFCKEKFHEEKKLEYYCQEASCKHCVCQKCATLHHQNHRMQSLEEAAQEIGKGLQKVISRVEGKKEKCQEELKQSKQNIESIRNEIELAKKEVRKAEEMICKKVRDHAIAMISALDQTLKEQTAANDREQSDINSNIELLSELPRQWKTLKERGVPYEMIESKEAFQKRSHVLLETPSVLCNMPLQRHITVRYVTSDQFLQSLHNIGNIVTNVTDPAQSTIESVKKVRLGFVNECTIITRNTKGKVCPTRIESIDVTIKDKEGNEVEKQLSQVKTGIYRVRYKPRKSGHHEIQVNIGGTRIKNSPQKIDIMDVNELFKPVKTFGGYVSGRGQLHNPYSIAVSDYEEIAIADCFNHRIQIFSLDGNFLREFGRKGIEEDQLIAPFGVVFNEERIIVSDGPVGKGRIQEFGLNGAYIRTIYRPEQWFDSRGLCINDDKNIAVCCSRNTKLGITPSIKVFSKQGDLVHEFDMPGHNEQPRYITYGNGKYFVTSLHTNYVRVFDKNGVFLYKFGEAGKRDGSRVGGLALYGPEKILICDVFDNRVRLFTQEGQFIRSFGLPGQMMYPTDIAVTPDGRVYVVEMLGNRVLIWS